MYLVQTKECLWFPLWCSFFGECLWLTKVAFAIRQCLCVSVRQCVNRQKMTEETEKRETHKRTTYCRMYQTDVTHKKPPYRSKKRRCISSVNSVITTVNVSCASWQCAAWASIKSQKMTKKNSNPPPLLPLNTSNPPPELRRTIPTRRYSQSHGYSRR